MTLVSLKKLDWEVEQWLKNAIPWTRAHIDFKGFYFIMRTASTMYKFRDLIAASGEVPITDVPNHRETMFVIAIALENY